MTPATILLAIALQSTAAPGPMRDRATAATGTAVISGRIQSDTQPPRPLRRVAVTVNTSDRTVGRTAITDDTGRYVVGGLPAGRYSVSATKSGWVTMSFGAKASDRPGRWITLADGQRVTADVRISRAGVITGTILDQNGQPPTGVTMRVMRYAFQFNTGERRLVPVGFSSWGPDDRGAYRIWGLAPGEYYVSAYTGGAFFMTQGRDLHLTSEVDVQEAVRAAQSSSAPLTDVVQPSVGVAPVFYPGTTATTQATPIVIRAGEERSGVDFTIQFVATSHVSGTVVGPEGNLPPGTQLNLVNTDPSMGVFGLEALRTARPSGSDGHFDFAEVTPGSYVLAARAVLPPAGPGLPSRALWAMADVDVQGEDVRGVSLQLQEGLTVSGVVRFDGNGPAPPLRSLRVNLMPAQGTVVSVSSGAGQVDAEGRFTFTGVTPGRYRLVAGAPSPQPAWTLRSATIGGQDSAETAVDIRQSVTDAVVTITDRISELTGRIVSQGPSRPDYTVIVFPTTRAQWTAPSRRILTARTADDGTFVFRILPPGEYFLAAVEDVEQGEWYDPAFLQRIAPTATTVTIAEGEKKIQDLQPGG